MESAAAAHGMFGGNGRPAGICQLLLIRRIRL